MITITLLYDGFNSNILYGFAFIYIGIIILPKVNEKIYWNDIGGFVLFFTLW